MANNFWETPEWISLKTRQTKTEKVLSKTEYLKMVGAVEFTEEKYKEYLKVMATAQQNSEEK